MLLARALMGGKKSRSAYHKVVSVFCFRSSIFDARVRWSGEKQLEEQSALGPTDIVRGKALHETRPDEGSVVLERSAMLSKNKIGMSIETSCNHSNSFAPSAAARQRARCCITHERRNMSRQT